MLLWQALESDSIPAIRIAHSKEVLELTGGAIAINEGHNKLITALRTTVEQDGKLDKEATSFDDLFDSFRLSLQRWASN